MISNKMNVFEKCIPNEFWISQKQDYWSSINELPFPPKKESLAIMPFPSWLFLNVHTYQQYHELNLCKTHISPITYKCPPPLQIPCCFRKNGRLWFWILSDQSIQMTKYSIWKCGTVTEMCFPRNYLILKSLTSFFVQISFFALLSKWQFLGGWAILGKKA